MSSPPTADAVLAWCDGSTCALRTYFIGFDGTVDPPVWFEELVAETDYPVQITTFDLNSEDWDASADYPFIALRDGDTGSVYTVGAGGVVQDSGYVGEPRFAG